MPPDRRFLSTQSIPVRERLIVALDLASPDEARRLVGTLDDVVLFYKLGLEMFMAGGYFELVDWLRARGKKVFVDLKFFDVPQTVRAAVTQLRSREVAFTTVHGNDDILAAALEGRGTNGGADALKILAVTVLTSLDQHDVEALGFQTDVSDLVLSRAKRAIALGCDGIISSGLEIRRLREQQAGGYLIVVPGIRPVANRREDDQKRTVDIEEAFLNGADYIVVGRPIKSAADPRQAAASIQRRIADLFVDPAHRP